MNVIKYLHPGTGERKSYRSGSAHRSSGMRYADERMNAMGFFRCGLRWGKARHVKTARRLEAKEKARK